MVIFLKSNWKLPCKTQVLATKNILVTDKSQMLDSWFREKLIERVKYILCVQRIFQLTLVMVRRGWKLYTDDMIGKKKKCR